MALPFTGTQQPSHSFDSYSLDIADSFIRHVRAEVRVTLDNGRLTLHLGQEPFPPLHFKGRVGLRGWKDPRTKGRVLPVRADGADLTPGSQLAFLRGLLIEPEPLYAVSRALRTTDGHWPQAEGGGEGHVFQCSQALGRTIVECRPTRAHLFSYGVGCLPVLPVIGGAFFGPAQSAEMVGDPRPGESGKLCFLATVEPHQPVL